MDDFCEQAGCSEKERKLHAWKWRKHRWHSHPIPTFVAWFEPTGVDPITGASVGGRPEARRIWARKDAGGYTRRYYGLPTLVAWNTGYVIKAFDAWTSAGSPEPDEPFISIAATLEAQQRLWQELKPIIAEIGKPMPPVYVDENANPYA